jgi:glucose/arabinose dehydrogenase
MQLQKIIFHTVLVIFTISNIACANTQFTDSDSDELPLPKERPQFDVETVATGLEVPWSIIFAPDGRIFVTERPGRIRLIDKDGKLLEKPLFVVKDVELESEPLRREYLFYKLRD